MTIITPNNCTSWHCPLSKKCACYKKQEQTDTEMYRNLFEFANVHIIGNKKSIECIYYVGK